MNNKFWGCVVAAFTALSCFSSCDEDEKVSMKLQGQWEGEFYACYTCKYKQEVNPRTYYAENTYMEFIPDHLFGSTRGTGYEVDFYPDNSPIKYSMYEFDWRIDDEVITLEYFDAPEMNTTIENYRLSYDRFRGYFGANKSSIDLRKLDSFDHSQYVSPYELRAEAYINDYYCGRTRASSDEVADSLVKILPEDVVIVSRGRKVKPEE